MKNKPTKKEKQAAHHQGPSKKQQESRLKALRKLRRVLGILLAVVGMAVYSNTLQHNYVLDDWGLIPENKLTRQGIDGIGEIFKTSYRTGMDATDNTLYRPFSKATFAVEWELSPNNPFLGHLDNMVLYGLLCFLLFTTLTRMFHGRMIVPFLTVLLYAVHPLHTEVVANIKSRDEILALIFLLLGLVAALRYGEDKKGSRLLFLGGYFFLAMLSKESSITWIAVIPLAMYFFDNRTWKDVIPVIVTTILPTALFLLIRQNILGGSVSEIPEVDNYMAGIESVLTQRTSAIAILGLYCFKFLVPSPLISDASYHYFKPYPITDWHFLISFAVFAALGIFAIRTFRTRNPISFAVLYFFLTISIVSNVVILIGTNYAERLMFTPSIGLCLLAALVLDRIFRSEGDEPVGLSDYFKRHTKPVGIAALIAVLFAGVTLARNPDWKDNYTLYTSDMKKVPESTHMRFYYANHISSEDFLSGKDSLETIRLQREAIAQLDTSIMIYPKYSEAYQRRAFIRFSMKDYTGSEPDFKKALELNPTDAVAHNNYGSLLFNNTRYEEARMHFENAVKYNPRYAHAWNNLASIYGVFGLGERDLAQQDIPNQAQHLANAKRNFETAVGYFNKSIEIDPEYAMPYYLLGMTYRNLGDEASAQRFIAKSEEVKKIKRYNASN